MVKLNLTMVREAGFVVVIVVVVVVFFLEVRCLSRRSVAFLSAMPFIYIIAEFHFISLSLLSHVPIQNIPSLA